MRSLTGALGDVEEFWNFEVPRVPLRHQLRLSLPAPFLGAIVMLLSRIENVEFLEEMGMDLWTAALQLGITILLFHSDPSTPFLLKYNSF